MSSMGWIIVTLVGGGLAGLFALGLVLWLSPRPRAPAQPLRAPSQAEPRRFVFRNDYLIDHSDNVGFLLPEPIDRLAAWDDLCQTLASSVDRIGPAMAALRATGRTFRLEGRFGRDRVHVMGERAREDIRITIAAAEANQNSLRVDLNSLRAMQDEIALLTASGDTSPSPSWIADEAGTVIWSNAAYQELAADCIGPDARHSWPIATLFPDEGGAPHGISRRKLDDLTGAARWFEISTQPPDARGLRHMHAVSLAGVIKAEDTLRTFIQTLTKTFAHLPTGLAIFDAERKLVLFNPALMDMTGLDGAWLSRRPTLIDVFDALRDSRNLPEPRDYKAWRTALTDPTSADAEGTYSETWTLPDGRNYRVTSRPQTDGAVTLMLEDVTADLSASRLRTDERAALESALAGLEEAVVVFRPDGERIAANQAAAQLLGLDPLAPLPGTLDDCVSQFQTRFGPSETWGDLRRCAKGDGPRAGAAWQEVLELEDGEAMQIKVSPARGGGLALAFARRAPGLLADVRSRTDEPPATATG